MERYLQIFIIMSFFLVAGVSLAGCSDDQDPASSGADLPATPAGPRFSAGDIVRSASGAESPAWLVVSYDAAGDSYSRALIYKNADGSYGYRTSPSVELSRRDIMEKVYTVKITQVSVESVPTAAPVTATTAITAMETGTTRPATTTATSTTATTSSAKPSIKAMDPEEGEAGTSVVTEITGSDFVADLTAELRRSGEKSIKAAKVSWYSSSSVTCTFELTNTTKVGTWDIVITNPNGQYGQITNYFMVRGNESGPL